MLDDAKPDPNLVRVVRDDRIAWIEMCDADGKNALGHAFVDALLAALREVDRDSSVHVAILTGLPGLFCSGASFEMLEDLEQGRVAPTELLLSSVLLNLSIPVIAACAGGAIGGGFALAISADLVVLAADRRYGFNFMNLGITPGMGTTRLAEHVLSPALAHELLYSGELRRGADFARGGVSAVVPSSEVHETAENLARRIAEKNRSNLGMLKRSLTLERRLAFESARTLESLMHEQSFSRLDLTEFGRGN